MKIVQDLGFVSSIPKGILGHPLSVFLAIRLTLYDSENVTHCIVPC